MVRASKCEMLSVDHEDADQFHLKHESVAWRRPAPGVDLSDDTILKYTHAGWPPGLLPPGCPPYPGTDSDFSSAPALSYCNPLCAHRKELKLFVCLVNFRSLLQRMSADMQHEPDL